MPPQVLPTVATMTAVTNSSGYFERSPMSTTSDEPGSKVAEMNAEANKPQSPDSGENSNMVVCSAGETLVVPAIFWLLSLIWLTRGANQAKSLGSQSAVTPEKFKAMRGFACLAARRLKVREQWPTFFNGALIGGARFNALLEGM